MPAGYGPRSMKENGKGPGSGGCLKRFHAVAIAAIKSFCFL